MKIPTTKELQKDYDHPCMKRIHFEVLDVIRGWIPVSPKGLHVYAKQDIRATIMKAPTIDGKKMVVWKPYQPREKISPIRGWVEADKLEGRQQ